MRDWPIALWAIFLGLCAAGFELIRLMFTYYTEFDLDRLYGYQLVVIVLYFFIRSIPADDVHIHHYVVALLVMLFLGY